MDTHRYDEYVARHEETFIEDVAALCALPSVSAENRHLPETADWLRGRLERAGFRTKTVRAEGGPDTIWAELGDGPRTLLFYNHYDVQPAEPLELWESDPFVLTERDGRLFARGVADDKADLLSRLHAVEGWLSTQGRLPARVRWLVEGEEEVGSVHLGEAADRYGDLWEADGCAWEGAGCDDEGRPVMYCGARGMLYVELRVRALERDLHSMYGGIVPNALWRLVGALGSLRDQEGHILVEGLRERVRPFTEEERQAVARLSFDGAKEAKNLGAPALLRQLDGQEAIAELINQPTANIAGIRGGYAGPGAKTVIPAEATAKMDFRLVPDLTADEALRLLAEHLRKRGFDDVEIVRLSGLDPARTPANHPVVAVAREAWADLGAADVAVYPSMAATGPVSVVIERLGIPTVMTGGVISAGNHIHSPNENIRRRDYFTAVRYWGRFLHRFAESSRFPHRGDRPSP